MVPGEESRGVSLVMSGHVPWRQVDTWGVVPGEESRGFSLVMSCPRTGGWNIHTAVPICLFCRYAWD